MTLANYYKDFPLFMANRLETSTPPFAAIDLGTNSAHLVIANMSKPGELLILETEKIKLRLGRAIDKYGNITEDGILRATDAIAHMVEIAKSYDAHIRAVATHATREASNHQELIQSVKKSTGIMVELIDGIEEARLSYLGMRHGLVLNDITCLGIDIGGGSTEISIARDDDTDYMGSFKLGAVNLTDRYLSNGTTDKAIAKLVDHIKMRLAPISRHIVDMDFQRAVASSGTAKALAVIHSKLIHNEDLNDPNGYEIPDVDLRRIIGELTSLATPKLIAKKTGIDISRAEIILAGAIILGEISKKFGVFKWVITTYGLREGIVADTMRRSRGKSNKLPDVQWHSIQTFAERCNIRGSHHIHVTKLATSIYDALAKDVIDPSLLPQFRRYLKSAAFLHEVGKFISEPSFHKHSMYLISNSRIPGFTEWERNFMGLIARYQRKKPPAAQDRQCKTLAPKYLKYLCFCSGILRLATALDRSRQTKITDIAVTCDLQSINLSLTLAKGYRAVVELRKAELEKANIEASLGRKVNISVQ